MFGKQHNNVLRAITNRLKNSKENSGLTCEPVEITDFSGKRVISHYLLNRDDFVLIVMRFTGAEATKVQWAYVQAFNEMERRLSLHQLSFDPAAYITGLIKENAVLEAQHSLQPLALPDGMELVPTIELLFRKAQAVRQVINESEGAFIDSVRDQFKLRNDLSPKQRAVLGEIVGRVERRAAKLQGATKCTSP